MNGAAEHMDRTRTRATTMDEYVPSLNSLSRTGILKKKRFRALCDTEPSKSITWVRVTYTFTVTLR